MLPVLFYIPGTNMPVTAYGVLIMLGFLGALYVAHLQGMRAGLKENDVWDFGFWALLGGIIGARIVFILVDWRQFFIEDPWTEIGSTGIKIPAIFAMWEGGLVYWGSMIGGFVAFLMYTKSRKLARWQFADFCALGVPIGQILGRLGCVAAGCCWGKHAYHFDAAGTPVADLPITMQFPVNSLPYNGMMRGASFEEAEAMRTFGETLPLFPSQLMESLGAGVILAILIFMYSRKRFHGQLLLSYAALYSVLRFFLESYRGDAARGFVFDGLMSTSQFISVLIILGCLGTIVYKYLKVPGVSSGKKMMV